MASLIGMATSGGWQITEKLNLPPDHTGGYFSDCYFVERGEEKAFLKVIDITRFEHASDLLRGLSEFDYETQLIKLSTERRMSRVVRLLESGELEVDPTNPSRILRKLPYLVFERGTGDIRNSIDVSTAVSDKWRFCVLHRATAGLLQLHQANIAHQDIKPSNVIQIAESELKIGDLGRSTMRGKGAPHDELAIAGALPYAPFELQYSYFLPDWLQRRVATDVFQIGCLALYVFTNVVLPSFVIERLEAPYRPGTWGDPYPNVIPHIKAALDRSLDELQQDFPQPFRQELASIIRDMCEPDPLKRGVGSGKVSNAGTVLWLQKFVSRFDILEKKASIAERGKYAK